MKTITLDRAIELLDSAYAVVVDGNELLYPQIGEEEEPFLILASEHGDAEEFEDTDNKTVSINKDGNMVLINTRGETTILSLLVRPDLNLAIKTGQIQAIN